ncbi:hypothetical protein PC116_g17155 [Phytophthora cactorum]|uniref:Uncharacterized protein n=1 Tax=Phytophthora cactorum TaxID=29920 RepID=A0A329RSF4_9STRA|nr:hypothetical protein Pcac1_g21654 [Phytophthora cactorum]KAG3110326.1 hypothetical protein PI125_g10120 [Phytophthora idaei]KAG4234695.1 hypothetical protein PC116_g17155 [Phytophthora cactorum]RAW27179.1 hypothetical protein PC110_g16424 [Phytophthora cactorum]
MGGSAQIGWNYVEERRLRPDQLTHDVDVRRCVEAKTAESGGLRDGEECEKESEAYRECRRKVKELKAAVKK